MTTQARRIDEAAFGVVYGSITVMAVLITVHAPVSDPARQAMVLFGTVLAVAVAKAYAELCNRMLETGQAAGWSDVRAVWAHSRTVLLAANGPALAFALAAFGLYSADVALIAAQGLAVGLLGYFGGRIGWRVRGTVPALAVGALVTGGLGVLVTLLKIAIH